MRKSTLLIATIAMACTNAQGQIAPAYGTENIYPGPETGAVKRTVHTSCYNRPGLIEGQPYELQAWAWNGQHFGSSAGIAWRHTNAASEATSQEGYIPAGTNGLPDGALDIEVAMYKGIESQPYLIAAYYKQDPTGLTSGHYFNTYKWTSSGLLLETVQQISTAPVYGRISIDAHRGYGVAIVWQDKDKIKIMTGLSSTGTMEFSHDILVANAIGGVTPDVAFAHYDDILYVKIAYMTQNEFNPAAGVIHVAGYKFYNLQELSSSAVNFVQEDVQPVSSFTPPNHSGTYNAYSLQLDCPDHSQSNHWSYVYRDADHIRARTRNGSATYSTTLDGIAPINNGESRYPTLAYNGDDSHILYGWYFENFLAAQGGYIAATADLNGTPSSYMYVANASTGFSGTPVMTFNKETDGTGQHFCAFPMMDNTGYYMVTKTKPDAATNFKPAPVSVKETSLAAARVMAYPSPFQSGFQLLVGQDNNMQTYSLTLSGIHGKTITQLNGRLAQINTQLGSIGPKLPQGCYVLEISGAGIKETLKIVKQ